MAFKCWYSGDCRRSVDPHYLTKFERGNSKNNEQDKNGGEAHVGSIYHIKYRKENHIVVDQRN